MLKLKKNYLFLLIIVIIGVIAGLLFANILSIDDKKVVYTKITTFFNDLYDDANIDYYQNLFTIIKNNSIYILLIIFFSLSVIGLLFNNFILFLKSFIMGFTIGSIINIYYYSGIVLSFFYIFPVQLFNLLLFIILIFNANNISMMIYENIFKAKDNHFKNILKKNMKLLFIIVFLFLLSALFETYLTPHILKLFSFLIE